MALRHDKFLTNFVVVKVLQFLKKVGIPGSEKLRIKEYM